MLLYSTLFYSFILFFFPFYSILSPLFYSLLYSLLPKVYVCRACDFDICNSCHDAAAAAEWSTLPGWLRLQCQAGGEGGCEEDGEGGGASAGNPNPSPKP